MSKLICPKCRKSGLTWQNPDLEDLLENGVMTCDSEECGAMFVGIQGFKDNLSFNFERPADTKSACGKVGIPHRMKRWNCYDTRCVNPRCSFKI